ncbi:thymopoietin a isoform X2 [Alosa sapidissima]|uniref:thymopoietin a isoform X2 n=1 Tax=Alosa sapidissima TaxID=34773 RepID=UPI001C0A292E|nr:thymopoietin a isoform X2 [Alosa sapidissima]
MSEFLDDPSVLTKEKLKSALLANNVSLPNGEQKKDVYVQLYLKNLTAQNKKKSAPPEAFSSDEELPAPVVSNRSRSGRKATRKTDKPRPDEVDVLELSDEDLREQLQKYGISVGPIVASTRKLYEKKLQKLLDEGPPEAVAPPVAITETDGNHNGSTEFDHYSDKEEETAAPEPEPEPEPAPVVVERPLRSRGKTPVTTRARSSQHNRRVAPVEEKPQLLDEEEDEEEPRLNIKRSFRRASTLLELAMIASDDIDFPDFPLSPVKPHVGEWRTELSEVLLMDKTFKSPPVESYTMGSTMPYRPAQNGTFQKVRDPQTVQPSARTGNNHQNSSSSRQKDKRGGTFTGSTDSLTKVPVVYLHDISHTKAKLPDPRPPVVIKPSEPSVFADAIEGSQHYTAGHLISSITSVGSCHEDSSAPPSTRQGSASGQPRHRKTQVSQTIEQVSKESTTEVHKVDGRQKKITPFLFPMTPLRGQSDSPSKTGIEKVSTVETPKADARDMLKEMFPNDVNTPTGISATCRRPIRGAAARAGISTDSWLDDSRLRLTETNYSSSSSSYVESRPSTRLLSSPLPASTYSSASTLRQAPASVLTARAPISGVPARRRRWLPVWAQVLVFGVLAGFLFLVYQAMETNESNPFGFLAQQAEEAPAGQTSK